MSSANKKVASKSLRSNNSTKEKFKNRIKTVVNSAALGGGLGMSVVGSKNYQINKDKLKRINETATIKLARLRDQLTSPERQEKARRIVRQLYRGRLSTQTGMRYNMPAPALDSSALDKAATRLNYRTYLRANKMLAHKLKYGEVMRALNKSKVAMGVGGLLTMGFLAPAFTKGIIHIPIPKEKKIKK